jgi:myo-inositol-1-phosphate synthase
MNPQGESVYIPFKDMLPMVNPNDLVIGGWDISDLNLAQSMERAQVLDFDLQRQLAPHMEHLKPLPSIYSPDFIAANQNDRASNVLPGNKQQQLEQIRKDIREFKLKNNLNKVIVLWTANTERFSSIEKGVNDTAEALLAAIQVSGNFSTLLRAFPIQQISFACVIFGYRFRISNYVASRNLMRKMSLIRLYVTFASRHLHLIYNDGCMSFFS